MRKAGRQGVLDAALRVIRSRGIHAATMRAIATEAGITEAAIYRHFRSKSHLLSELFRQCAEMLYAYLDAAAGSIADPTDRLAALARAFFDFALEYPEQYTYIAAVHHHQLRVDPVPPDRLPKRLFTDAIAQILGPDASPDEIELTAGAIIGAVMGLVLIVDIGSAEDIHRARHFAAEAARCLAPRPTNTG